MTHQLVTQGVAEWVCEKAGGVPGPGMQAIGLVSNGVLVAGAAFENWTGTNVFCHLRVDRPPSKKFYREVSRYVFETLGCIRCTATIPMTHKASIRIARRAGFELEAWLTKAARSGDNLGVFVLWRENCRMLNW